MTTPTTTDVSPNAQSVLLCAMQQLQQACGRWLCAWPGRPPALRQGAFGEQSDAALGADVSRLCERGERWLANHYCTGAHVHDRGLSASGTLFYCSLFARELLRRIEHETDTLGGAVANGSLVDSAAAAAARLAPQANVALRLLQAHTSAREEATLGPRRRQRRHRRMGRRNRMFPAVVAGAGAAALPVAPPAGPPPKSDASVGQLFALLRALQVQCRGGSACAMEPTAASVAFATARRQRAIRSKGAAIVRAKDTLDGPATVGTAALRADRPTLPLLDEAKATTLDGPALRLVLLDTIHTVQREVGGLAWQLVQTVPSRALSGDELGEADRLSMELPPCWLLSGAPVARTASAVPPAGGHDGDGARFRLLSNSDKVHAVVEHAARASACLWRWEALFQNRRVLRPPFAQAAASRLLGSFFHPRLAFREPDSSVRECIVGLVYSHQLQLSEREEYLQMFPRQTVDTPLLEVLNNVCPPELILKWQQQVSLSLSLSLSLSVSRAPSQSRRLVLTD